MRSHRDKQTSPLLCVLLFIVSAILSSSNTSATSPEFKPMSISEKIKISDSIFLGTVRKLYFTDAKTTSAESSQQHKVLGYTALVDCNKETGSDSPRETVLPK